jgi:hypothetical protein
MCVTSMLEKAEKENEIWDKNNNYRNGKIGKIILCDYPPAGNL